MDAYGLEGEAVATFVHEQVDAIAKQPGCDHGIVQPETKTDAKQKQFVAVQGKDQARPSPAMTSFKEIGQRARRGAEKDIIHSVIQVHEHCGSSEGQPTCRRMG
jgi:hypothetical protein